MHSLGVKAKNMRAMLFDFDSCKYGLVSTSRAGGKEKALAVFQKFWDEWDHADVMNESYGKRPESVDEIKEERYFTCQSCNGTKTIAGDYTCVECSKDFTSGGRECYVYEFIF